MPQLQLATFRVDVTPPLGHPLCAGWIQPVEGVTDPQYALGVALLGDDAPIVLCAVDWCEIRAEDHIYWREKLAAATRTTPERVAVHCVHQHNAPLMDMAAQRLIAPYPELPPFMDVDWFTRTVARVAEKAEQTLNATRAVTHIGIGQARVEQVASNRRVIGEDGKVKGIRWSACKDAELCSEPEGMIDPVLKTISFWNDDEKLAVLHYYATHPMSYYGDGQVTSDFAGLARERRTTENNGSTHLYFTGCAGDVTAGKYNDGSPENRPILSERMYRAMVESEQKVERVAIDRCEWRTQWEVLPPRADLSEEELLKTIGDVEQSDVPRKNAALALVYLRSTIAQSAIPLTSLRLGDRVCILHLPGEPFIEYQLFAQQQRSDSFVAVAGYGDGITGYIPLAHSYAEGGYEPTASFVAPEAEAFLKDVIRNLVQ